MLGSGGGGAELGELSRSLGLEGGDSLGESGFVLRSLFCCFVLCIPLIYITVVPVPFVCCSVKLSLSRPISFCLFLSILLCTREGGGAAACHFCCWPQPNHNSASPKEKNQ